MKKTAAGQPPGRAGPLHSNADAYQIAVEALAEARSFRDLASEREQHVIELRERVWKGDRWMAGHDEGHPRFERNRQRLSRLRWEHEQERWMLRDARLKLMDRSLAFFTVYEALTPIEQQAIGFEDDLERPDPEMWERFNNNWHELGLD